MQHYFQIFLSVQSIFSFIASSITNTSELSEGISIRDFRQLFKLSTPISSVLATYVNGFDVILPNSSIGGQYTCQAGDQMRNLSIIVSSMSSSCNNK